MPIQMFDDGQKDFNEAVQTFGVQVGGLLRDRLHKKQFEDFLAGPSRDFKDSMQQAQDVLMDEANPEGPAQGMQMLKGALETYMDEGARYADNPIIQQRVQSAFKFNMDFLNMNYKMKFDAYNAEKAKVTEARETEMFGLKKANMEAQTKERLAKAGKADAEAQAKGDVGASNLFSGAPGSIPAGGESARAHELWSRINNTIDRPSSEAERKSVDAGLGEVRTQMAQLKLGEMVGRGEQKPAGKDASGMPTGGGYWDVFNPDHLADVAATIDPAEVRNHFIMNKAKAEAPQQGVNPESLDKEFGIIVDPSKANAFRPLSQPVSQDNLGKILFGAGGWDSLRDAKTRLAPATLEVTMSRLPASIEDVQGPIGQAFKRFTAGELPEGVDRNSIKSIDDIKNLLHKQAYDLITAAIGNNASSKSLSEGMKQNRLDALNLVNAMTEKYAAEIYATITVKAKKAPQGKSDAELVEGNPLLSGVARRVGAITTGLLKPLQKSYRSYTED
jgi:hypothetical protein